MPVLVRLLPYALAFTSSLCIMILELVSSRLVARHVGSSLTVWTSVIGIILGGICLGNVLGGRLSDKVDPRRAVGSLFGLGAFLTLGSLWMNAEIGRILPRPDQMNWELRTILVVLIDFLVPATVLGMVGPVVAKMAVEQARRAGSAIGDVYFWGAVGSIVGTLVCGFWLQVWFGTFAITLLVAAGLSLLAAALMPVLAGRVAALVAAILLVVGSIPAVTERVGGNAVKIGLYEINYFVALGYLVALVVAAMAIGGLFSARRSDETVAEEIPLAVPPAKGSEEPLDTRTGLADLAVLAFLASMIFMSLEMAAGRLVTRHLGSSIYGWSSVIAVLLAGLSLGNFLGGKLADFIRNEKQASWLFLLASILTLSILALETPPRWVSEKVFHQAVQKSVLMSAPSLTSIGLPGGITVDLSWQYRILIVTTLVFFLPALSLGTVSPVVAKLAVDRLRRFQRTGTAIGQVYAWGMVGSILGTFLTGFVFIDFLGTKGVILALGTILALSATFLGELVHAIWAGIPLGLCVIAFLPPQWCSVVRYLPQFSFISQITPESFTRMGEGWGVREPMGDPTTTADELAYVDESDYYYIKIENEPEEGGELQRRTLVLDNLIHGYFILNHPERLDYDYEHIYALIAYRAAKAGNKVKFKPEAANGPPEPAPAAGRGPDGATGKTPAKSSPAAKGQPAPPPVPATALPEAPTPPHPEAPPEAVSASKTAKPAEAAPAKPAGAAPAKPAETAPARPAGAAPARPAPPPAPAASPAAKPPGGLLSVAPSYQEGKAPAGSSETKGAGPAASTDNAQGPGASGGATQKGGGASGAANPAAGKKALDPTEIVLPPPDDLKNLKSLLDLKTELDRSEKKPQPYLPPVEPNGSSLKTLFLGGGAYCFQRHMKFAYPGTSVDVAEIDPAVTRANRMATGLSDADQIETHWGDARQFVELNQDSKQYDLIFGDAFNDFSVPWHLTTREFNEKIKKMLSPNGVYMINIIDVYLTEENIPERVAEEIKDREQELKDSISDKWLAKAELKQVTQEQAEERAREEIDKAVPLSESTRKAIERKWERKAKIYGGFVGAWTKTAMLTFGKENVYLFGTDIPGKGRRETFVVVASMKPLDIKELGLRKDDPRFFTPSGRQTLPKAYGQKDFDTVVNDRSRGIVLTDDYAPVENLLAPVAETRGDRE